MLQYRDTSFGKMLTLETAHGNVEVLSFASKGRDHTHDEWEHALCIRGPCDLIIDGETSRVVPGVTYSIPPFTRHHMRPLGPHPSTWVVWYSDDERRVARYTSVFMHPMDARNLRDDPHGYRRVPMQGHESVEFSVPVHMILPEEKG